MLFGHEPVYVVIFLACCLATSFLMEGVASVRDKAVNKGARRLLFGFVCNRIVGVLRTAPMKTQGFAAVTL